jgi:YVTN family beta-propeller protein
VINILFDVDMNVVSEKGVSMCRDNLLKLFLFVFLCATVVANAQSVTEQVFLGGNTNGIGFNPVTNTIYVGNSNLGSVFVVDGRTQSLVTTIETGKWLVQALAVNWRTNRLYLTTQNFGTQQCFVEVVDGRTNQIIDTIDIGVKVNLGLPSIAVNPLANRIYIADPSDNAVLVMEGVHDKIVASISVGSYPVSVAVNSITNRIYTVLQNPFGKLVTISGASNAALQTIPIGAFPTSVVADLANNRILAVTDNGIYVVDGKSHQVLTVTTRFSSPTFDVDPFTNRLWLSSFSAATSSSTLYLLNARTYGVLSSFSLGGSLRSLVVNPLTNTGYGLDGNFLDLIPGRHQP